MRKSFTQLKAAALGDIVMLSQGVRHTLNGVSSHPLSVIVEPEIGGPLLFKQFGPGDFSFDVSNPTPFALWFDADPACVVSIEMPRGAVPVVQTRSDSLTDMSPRPALNPAMEALLRKMNLMSHEIGALKVRDLIKDRKAALPPKVDEPTGPPKVPVVIDEQTTGPDPVDDDTPKPKTVKPSPDIGGTPE
jgi:hypothetical protein